MSDEWKMLSLKSFTNKEGYHVLVLERGQNGATELPAMRRKL
jgi:hypothetical protein